MDLHRVDLNLLRLVEAVLREGSASRAAVVLRLSQPAVSQGLRRAREVFGDPLLARHGNRLIPTPRGMALLPELRAILDQVEGARALAPRSWVLLGRRPQLAVGRQQVLCERVLYAACQAHELPRLRVDERARGGGSHSQ